MLLHMKTIKTILVAGITSLLIAGCATSFKPWKLSDVEEGMDRDQVIKILGEPDYVVETNSSETLYYTYRAEMTPASSTLDSQEDIDRRVKELTGTLTESKYEVVMFADKMISYKEVKD